MESLYGKTGQLLELLKIREMEEFRQFTAIRIVNEENAWKQDEKWTFLGNKGCIWSFDGVGIELQSQNRLPNWHVIKMPYCFPVVDVVLVDMQNGPIYYMVQITTSRKPFATHYTNL